MRSSPSRLDTRWFVKGERKAPGGEDGSVVASLKTEIDRLTRTNAALETENGQLKAEIETAQGKSTVAPKPSPVAPAATPTWRATPKSEKLTKDQAEAFNALNAAGKTKWLADNPEPA